MKTYSSCLTWYTSTALSIGLLLGSHQPGFAADQVIAGSSAIGNLVVTLHDNGSMDVDQYVSSVTAPKIDSGGNQKGSFLFANGQSCGLGLFSTTGQTIVDNQPSGPNSVTTTIDCMGLGLRFIQETTYFDFSTEIYYRWRIQNMSAGAVSDIRFFHGSNFILGLGASTADGFYDSAFKMVGGIQSDSSGYEVALLRSFLSPVNYQSGDQPNSVSSSVVTSNSLPDGLSDDASAYALQWNMSSLKAGEEFVIDGVERFSNQPNFDKLIVISPIQEFTLVGQQITPSFRIKNDGFGPLTITALTPMTPVNGWSVSLANPPTLPINIAVGDSLTVDVLVDPGSTTGGTRGPVVLEVQASGTAQDVFILDVLDPPPTPTPTPTATPTNTPTFTPTIPPARDIVVTAPLRAVRNDKPLVTGTSFPGATIEVIIDGTAIGTTTADSKGSWSLQTLVAISRGVHSLTATATDPFGRKSTLPSTRPFVATGGAILDFDGDGLTDIASYASIGGSVAFKWVRSADDSAVTTAIAGRVPAPGDYDGDGITDFATVDRVGQNLLWRVRFSSTSGVIERVFGEVGEKPLTGCSLVEAGRSSFALIKKDGTYRAMDAVSSKTVDTSSFGKGQILTCADVSGDRLDELVVSTTKGDEVTVSTRTLTGEVLDSFDGPSFDRVFPIRFGSVEPGAAVAVVRLVSAGQRRASLMPIATTFAPIKLQLPRKVVFSSGTILDQSGKAVVNVIAQDTGKNRLFRQGILAGDEQVSLGRTPVKAQLLQPQYIYRTAR